MGNDHTGLGNQGGQDLFHFTGISIGQFNYLGNDLVLRILDARPANGGNGLGSRLYRRNNLDYRPAGDRGKAIHLQDRFKDLVGILLGYPGWRNNGHLAPDCPVNDKILFCQLTDIFDEQIDIHIIEINGDISLRR